MQPRWVSTQVGPGLNIRTPRCWYGAITNDHTRFTLLLDDMFPATPGIQTEGRTVDQAAASLRNLVGLHIPWLDDPKLRRMEIPMRRKDTAAMMAQVMSQACEAYMERHADDAAPEDGETLRRACTVIERRQLAEASPFSVIHGDYRLDNPLFDPATGEATAVDWQTAAIGPPLAMWPTSSARVCEVKTGQPTKSRWSVPTTLLSFRVASACTASIIVGTTNASGNSRGR